MRRMVFEPGFAGWKEKAREALAAKLRPETVHWEEAGSDGPPLDLFEQAPEPPTRELSAIRVPGEFAEAAGRASLHSAPNRWALLYRVLWRLVNENPRLLENPADADTIALARLQSQVKKDAYRMTAFLRFREIRVEGESWFAAWYEPEHDTLELNAPFFIGRFPNMRWSILTPRRCVHWDGLELRFTAGVPRSAAPQPDQLEQLWMSYYSNIFNPARLNLRAMRAQLLKRNWKNLPEAAVIEPLVRQARPRAAGMVLGGSTAKEREEMPPPGFAPGGTWLDLRGAAAHCRECPLWEHATQAVFGEGPLRAPLVLVGEQPGDQEDRAGRAFIGPAGQVLNQALAEAGIDRGAAYITNAVKHFKFEGRGERRVHKRPAFQEVASCRRWLRAELEMIQPRLTVALGSTAAHALLGRPIPVLRERGNVFRNIVGGPTFVTVHPSSLLRLPDPRDYEAHFRRFVEDLRSAKALLENQHFLTANEREYR